MEGKSMNINLQNNKVEFKEFLLNKDIVQGVIQFEKEEYFAHKLKENSGAYSIFLIDYYGQYKVSPEYDKYKFVLSIDTINKIIIYIDCYRRIDLKNKLSDLSLEDYQIWDTKKLEEHIQNQYKSKLIKLFDYNTEKFMDKFIEYKEEYNKTLEDKMHVERDYFNDRCDYRLHVCKLVGYSCNDLENLRNYLKQKSCIDKIVQDKFEQETKKYKCNSVLHYHAQNQARKKVLKQIQENPSQYVKLYLKIKESIQEGGKTLNIITKDNEKFKVDNRLINCEFRTIKGWNEIKIEDIAKITFGRKILFQLD